MPAVLSDLERQILDYMVRYLRTRTYQPSIREIGEEFGIKSTKTVSEHLKALAQKGYVERDPSRSRGVRILGVDLSPDTVSVPCYNRLPNPETQRKTDGVDFYLSLDRRISGAKGAYFVRARGTEFAGADVHKGDLILVEPVASEALEHGALVVASLGNGPQLYRYTADAGAVRLHPVSGGEPVAVEDPDRLPVTGRVTAIHRRLDGAGIPRKATAH